jgi:hypothetical protein
LSANGSICLEALSLTIKTNGDDDEDELEDELEDDTEYTPILFVFSVVVSFVAVKLVKNDLINFPVDLNCLVDR